MKVYLLIKNDIIIRCAYLYEYEAKDYLTAVRDDLRSAYKIVPITLYNGGFCLSHVRPCDLKKQGPFDRAYYKDSFLHYVKVGYTHVEGKIYQSNKTGHVFHIVDIDKEWKNLK